MHLRPLLHLLPSHSRQLPLAESQGRGARGTRERLGPSPTRVPGMDVRQLHGLLGEVAGFP